MLFIPRVLQASNKRKNKEPPNARHTSTLCYQPRVPSKKKFSDNTSPLLFYNWRMQLQGCTLCCTDPHTECYMMTNPDRLEDDKYFFKYLIKTSHRAAAKTQCWYWQFFRVLETLRWDWSKRATPRALPCSEWRVSSESPVSFFCRVRCYGVTRCDDDEDGVFYGVVYQV